MSNYPADFRGLPEEQWSNSPAPKGMTAADHNWNATRKAQIIAEHEARGCTCNSCTVRKAALDGVAA